jgi:glycosyltransferase involved in cell wall biosynthesis
MRITYVGFGDFHRYAGMKQLYHFAQEVCRQGHQAQILIAGKAKTVASMEERPAAEIVELAFTGPRLSGSVTSRVRQFHPDILHVWTPRHVPALAGWQLHSQTGATVILDHEDDETYLRWLYLTSQGAGFGGLLGLAARPVARTKGRILPWLCPLKPDGSVRRMAQDTPAAALLRPCVRVHTAISPALVTQVSSTWSAAPVHLLYPGANLSLFNPRANRDAIRLQHDLKPSQPVLIYTGTLSLQIFRYFLSVLQSLLTEVPDAYLLLVGNDEYRDEAQLLTQNAGLQNHVALTGIVPYTKIPEYLAAADVLLQHPLDIGNELRLPAKLPEYLAMGKPLVMYSQGIGRILEHGVHALKLETSEPPEMSQLVLTLLKDASLRTRLGEQARALAERLFDWRLNSSTLVDIYEQTLGIKAGSQSETR